MMCTNFMRNLNQFNLVALHCWSVYKIDRWVHHVHQHISIPLESSISSVHISCGGAN